MRKHGLAVAAAFRVADVDLDAIEVDVFDAQGQCFEKTHSGSIEEERDEMGEAGQSAQDFSRFFRGQYNREPGRAGGADDVFEPRQWLIQDVAIKEQQRA